MEVLEELEAGVDDLEVFDEEDVDVVVVGVKLNGLSHSYNVLNLLPLIYPDSPPHPP